jgi:serine phosphatase RsbU (regulator of sigma subunit)
MINRRSLYVVPALTLLLGVAITVVLATLSHHVYERNQQRLLELRTKDAALVVGAALPNLEADLVAATEIADASRGRSATLGQALLADVSGTNPSFRTISVWRLGHLRSGPILTAGRSMRFSRAIVASLLAMAERVPGNVAVVGRLEGRHPHLLYAHAAPDGRGYGVIASSPISPQRRLRIGRNSPFAGLEVAIFYGSDTSRADLLATNVRRLPIAGEHAVASTPFADARITVELATRHSLSGSLPASLWLIILGSGLALAVLAAGAALLLMRGRLRAEVLADALHKSARELESRYVQQRSIAETLQHALLPERLPDVAGLQVAARYQAGEESIDVGGDWYDLVELDDRCAMLVVGDISGRGLSAATTMASLRHAIHAYAIDGDPPGAILTKLTRLLDVSSTGQLATVLCVGIDVGGHELRIACAGHLPPMLIESGGPHYLEIASGMPIGVQAGAEYVETTIAVDPGATLLAFTDGLVERRGETLDEGLDRVAGIVGGDSQPLSELITALVDAQAGEAAQDDIAIVGIHWMS